MNSQQRYQMLLEAASDYAVFFTDEDGTITDWSSGAEKVLGYSGDEIIGRSIEVLFTPETVHLAKAERIEASSTGQAADERWHLKKGQERFFASGRLIALQDRDGRAGGFAKILRDRTAQKLAEEAFQRNSAKFQTFFELAGSGNLEIDIATLRIISANRKFCEITGYGDQELKSLNLLEIIHPEDRQKDLDHLATLKASAATSVTHEKRYLHKNGSVIWLHEALTLLPGQNSETHLFAVYQDITALKNLEHDLEKRIQERTHALEEKSKQIEDMCYTVAHDLRAPLRSISGYVDIIKEENDSRLDADAKAYLDRIKRSALSLDDLILDLLTYRRVEHITLPPEDISLDQVLQRVLEELAADIERTAAQISVENPLGRVFADTFSVDHMLRNLVSNALKFTHPQTAPKIRIYTVPAEKMIRLLVEDQGIGVPAHFAKRIFQLFEKLPTAQSHLGTGVGLAIVATLASRLGGRSGVEPNPEGGSRFWIDLPASTQTRVVE